MRFENKTAVVTGGSRGIGLAIATKLAKRVLISQFSMLVTKTRALRPRKSFHSTAQRLSSISVMFQTLKSQRRLSIRSLRSSAVSKFL